MRFPVDNLTQWIDQAGITAVIDLITVITYPVHTNSITLIFNRTCVDQCFPWCTSALLAKR